MRRAQVHVDSALRKQRWARQYGGSTCMWTVFAETAVGAHLRRAQIHVDGVLQRRRWARKCRGEQWRTFIELNNNKELTEEKELNLPGWCWAEIQQLALIGSSSSLHSEACNALGAPDGVIYSRISHEVVCLRATANNEQKVRFEEVSLLTKLAGLCPSLHKTCRMVPWN